MVSIFLSHDGLQSISSGQVLRGVCLRAAYTPSRSVQGIHHTIYSLLFFDIVVC
jgi:hypothetical protein